MTILITAFDPFGGGETNASMEVLRALPERIAGAAIRTLIVPTVFGLSARLAAEELDRCGADGVICLGQAEGRTALTPERVAVNVMDARMSDNAGYQPADEPVVPGGPAAYFSTLPIRTMTAAMNSLGLPARISDSAGTFVCNSVMYAVLRHAAGAEKNIPCGFIHIPCLDCQEGLAPEVPTVKKEIAVRAVTAAAEVLIRQLQEAAGENERGGQDG